MTFLLDVNVLVALIDRNHTYHDAAHTWFNARDQIDWATCPLTENGVMRIVGHPRYPNSLGSPAIVADSLQSLRSLAGHLFWHDDFSLLGSDLVATDRILTSAQVTDTYLLALAGSKCGQLASFDRRLSTAAVNGGSGALHIITTT